MKRTIALLAFAVLAVPALAAESGAPFEQTQLDRAAALGPGGGNAAAGATASRNQAPAWGSDHNFIAPAN